LKYLGNHLNGTVGQTETDPNALGESGKKEFQWRH